MQQDLFNYANQQNDTPGLKSRFSGQEPGVVTLRFEQILVTVIGLLVLYAFVYSWGFEKGRNAMIDSSKQMASVSVSQPTPPVTNQAVTLELPAVTQEEVFEAAAPEVGGEIEAQPMIVTPEVHEEATLLEKVIQDHPKTPEGRFTIQHVTYLKESQADEEIKKLTKMGYDPFLVPSGKYLQICINGFNTKADAVKVLKKLKNDGIVALDAYIRNMPQLG